MRRFQTQTMVVILWATISWAQSPKTNKELAPVLPSPKGAFAVGRMGFDWTDATRKEVLSQKLDAKRELMVYVWYPAEKQSKGGKKAPYLPGAAAINKLSDRALSGADGKLWPAILSGQLVTHAVADATPAKNSTQFPVLLFSHGLVSPVFHYTAFIEELVSQGYIVASIEHTYEVNVVAFPDGRLIALSPISWRIYGPQPPEISEEESDKKAIAWEKERDSIWAADISFVIDQLTKVNQDRGSRFFGKLDLDHVGAFGHSIGGRAVGRACELDRRITACVSEDGAADEGIVLTYPGADSPTQPFLLEEAFVAPPTDQDLTEAHESRQQFNESIARQDAAIERQLRHCREGYRVTIESPDINHDSFTDIPVLESFDDSKAQAVAAHSLGLSIDVTRAFFDKYLKAENGNFLDRVAGFGSEITVKHYDSSNR